MTYREKYEEWLRQADPETAEELRALTEPGCGASWAPGRTG